MITTPFGYVINLRCPHCARVQPFSQLFRTNDLYFPGAITGIFGALGRPLAIWDCRKCAKELRLADYIKPQRFVLFVPTFFILCTMIFSVLDNVSLFASVDPLYAGYINFVSAGALSVLIALYVSTRSLKVEIIE